MTPEECAGVAYCGDGWPNCDSIQQEADPLPGHVSGGDDVISEMGPCARSQAARPVEVHRLDRASHWGRWSMAEHIRSELVGDALQTATRRYRTAPGRSCTPTAGRRASRLCEAG
jgi:hypothetical protein